MGCFKTFRCFAVLNALGIPRSYSLPSNTICIISTPSNRSMVMGNHKYETISVSLRFSCESSRSPVFSNSSSRSGVMHRIAFNTFADSISEHYYYHCDVYNQNHDIQIPNSKQPTKVQRHTIQATTAVPKEKAMKYQLDLPSYFAR